MKTPARDATLPLAVEPSPRILVVDDNEDIHRDFRGVLDSGTKRSSALDTLDAELFGRTRAVTDACYEIDSAYQGEEAIETVKAALAEKRPYSFAFVDVRMPPGLDGVRTTAELLRIDPDLSIVICSAYSDHSWEDMVEVFGDTDRVLILKKPFDAIEVRQLAQALRRRWQLGKEAALKLEDLQSLVNARTDELRKANEELRAEAAAREKAEAELRLKQKLESVGQLAAGIAHEINTPMQYIGDNLSFLKTAFEDYQKLLSAYGRAYGRIEDAGVAAEIREVAEAMDIETLSKEIPDALEETFQGVKQVSEIVLSMKEFSHPDEKEMSHADLNKIIRNTLAVARNEYRYVARVHTDLGEIPSVLCHAGDIGQVMLDLIVNAAHAIADEVQDGETGEIHVSSALDGEGRVAVTVRDTGAGIPAEIRDRIFDPFFTTKDVGRGTGQGLAIARSVVDRHGGTLTFDTAPGQGTTFYLRLPVASAGGER